MNKKHLLWIIPALLIVGFVIGSLLTSFGTVLYLEEYPVATCIIDMDRALNVENNRLTFTVESQKKAIEWRCAKEYVDFNASYEEIFEMIE